MAYQFKVSSIPREVIDGIVDEVECGMICFLNPVTHKHVSVFGDSYWGHDEEFDREIYDEVDQWERFIRIDPMESFESFKVMASFIESDCFDRDLDMKRRLIDAISGPKPFRRFKHLVETSQYRQLWFRFRRRAIEEYVKEQIGYSQI